MELEKQIEQILSDAKKEFEVASAIGEEHLADTLFKRMYSITNTLESEDCTNTEINQRYQRYISESLYVMPHLAVKCNTQNNPGLSELEKNLILGICDLNIEYSKTKAIRMYEYDSGLAPQGVDYKQYVNGKPGLYEVVKKQSDFIKKSLGFEEKFAKYKSSFLENFEELNKEKYTAENLIDFNKKCLAEFDNIFGDMQEIFVKVRNAYATLNIEKSTTYKEKDDAMECEIQQKLDQGAKPSELRNVEKKYMSALMTKHKYNTAMGTESNILGRMDDDFMSELIHITEAVESQYLSKNPDAYANLLLHSELMKRGKKLL